MRGRAVGLAGLALLATVGCGESTDPLAARGRQVYLSQCAQLSLIHI